MIEEFFNRQENGVKVYKVYIIRHEISPARRILKGSGGGWGIPRKKAYNRLFVIFCPHSSLIIFVFALVKKKCYIS